MKLFHSFFKYNNFFFNQRGKFCFSFPFEGKRKITLHTKEYQGKFNFKNRPCGTNCVEDGMTTGMTKQQSQLKQTQIKTATTIRSALVSKLTYRKKHIH